MHAARFAVPKLGELLNRDRTDEGLIGRVFRSIGADAAAPLVENIKKSSGEAKCRTIRMLAWIGPPAREALP